jgi:hypothetical protein
MARVIASARVESSVCWIYGWTRDGASGCFTLHACISVELRVHHGSLPCTACCTAPTVQSSVDEFRSGLWPKATRRHPALDLVYLLSQNGTLIRPASTKVRYWTTVALFHAIVVQVGVYGGWIWS